MSPCVCLPAKQACFFIHTTYWKLLAVQLRVSSAAAAAAAAGGQKKKTKTKTKKKKKKKKRFSLIYFVCLGFFSFLLCVWGASSWVGRCVYSCVAVSSSSRRFFLRSSASAGRQQRGAYAQVSVQSDSNHAAPAAAACLCTRQRQIRVLGGRGRGRGRGFAFCLFVTGLY